IICLVRPQNDPNGTPRILLINKATPTLINYLNQNPQPATFPVMHSVPGTNNNMNVGTGSPVAEANSSATGIQTAVRPQDRYLPPLDPNPFTNPPGVNNSPWAQQDLNR
ncbi:MAG: hypothetical protein KDA65_18165, partial [Planctomycetaceae bacterium]|nr:hypothetical protein [Planctomycetaceae bacterium]